MAEVLPVDHTSKWKKRRDEEKYLAYCFMNPATFPVLTAVGDQLLLCGSDKPVVCLILHLHKAKCLTKVHFKIMTSLKQ